MSEYSSKLLETTVNEFARLPGIGKKTALRLALHLLKRDIVTSESLGNAIIKMRNDIVFCSKCNNISDTQLCELCKNPNRKTSIICVVEDIRDVMAIENTGQFNGLYHILGGVISPMDGISPNDLNIDSLINRILEDEVQEVILALPTTMEGDTTCFYIYKRLQGQNVSISAIARGVSIGDDLEYTDEVTLGRSILNRIPYEGSNNM